MEKSEDQMNDYAQKHSILFITEKQNLVNDRLEQLEQQYTKAQAARFEAESKYSLVKSGKETDLPSVLSDKLIQDLEGRLAELDRQYAEMTSVVKPEFPKAVQLKNQIDVLQAKIQDQKKALVENIVQEYQAAAAN